MRDGMNILSALVLALGIALGGYCVGAGFKEGRATDRYVTVKGLSERDVKADLALWPLRFVSTDNDLKVAQGKIGESHKQVLAFLEKNGIDAARAEVQELEVNDLLANPYRSGPVESRFIISETIMVRSDDPESVIRASQGVNELVESGVILSSQGMGRMGPTFLSTRLTELKPEMIAEATAEARRAAEQFAKDSQSHIGGIRRANQGVFQILARDRAPGINEGSQINKTVRVVTTVEYELM